MKIYLDRYVVGKKTMQEWYLKQHMGICECISLISVTTHIPVIVCAFYIGEVAGWPEEVLETIERLKKSYGYTEIVGIPEGFPGRKE